MGRFHALNAALPVLAGHPEARPVCAAIGAIPAETADKLQWLFAVDRCVIGNLEVASRGIERNGVVDEDRVAAPGAPDRHLADAIEAVVHGTVLAHRHLDDDRASESRYRSAPFRAMAALRGRETERA